MTDQEHTHRPVSLTCIDCYNLQKNAELSKAKELLDNPTVHILRNWDIEKIKSFALHLLGDGYQDLQFQLQDAKEEIIELKKLLADKPSDRL